jgi:hypothetical protein
LLAAVEPKETVPPLPVDAPAAKVTVEAVMEQVGKSVAPVGEFVSVHALKVTVLGPT